MLPVENDDKKKLQVINEVMKIIQQDREQTEQMLQEFQDIFFDDLEKIKTKEERVAVQNNLIELLKTKQKSTENLIKLINALNKDVNKINIHINEKGIDTSKFIDEI